MIDAVTITPDDAARAIDQGDYIRDADNWPGDRDGPSTASYLRAIALGLIALTNAVTDTNAHLRGES